MNKVGLGAIVLLLVLAPLALVGCERPVAATDGSETGYTGALDVSYEGALDATSQLALGTVQLEGTPNAVTETQAGQLLPLWQALQSGALQGTDESDAVTRQIEHTMSDAQIQAIVAMRLTDADVATWIEGQAGALSVPGDASQGDAPQWTAPQGGSGEGQRLSGAGQGLTDEQIAQMRQRFQDASPKALATRRAQFAGQGGQPGTVVRASAGSSRLLMEAVTRLLVERSGADAVPQEPPDATPAALVPERVEPMETPDAAPVTATPEATSTGSPTPPTPQTTLAPAQTSTPAETPGSEATPTSSPTPTSSATPTPSPASARTATLEPEQAAAPTSTSALYTVRASDTLAAIAQAYGVTVSAIVEANSIQDPNVIEVGQALVIPDPAQVPTAS
ncbi:MAG: LysM peptidoglycan-binding domain-containing protein, partial [Anaerolineae bacterium]